MLASLKFEASGTKSLTFFHLLIVGITETTNFKELTLNDVCSVKIPKYIISKTSEHFSVLTQ